MVQACGVRARELPAGIEIEGAMTSLQHAQVLVVDEGGSSHVT